MSWHVCECGTSLPPSVTRCVNCGKAIEGRVYQAGENADKRDWPDPNDCSPKALDRLEKLTVESFLELFDLFDHVLLSHSGGKDSTCAMEMGAQAARQLGRKLHCIFFDEEILHWETVEIMMRTRERDDIHLDWYAVPLAHKNAWDKDHPFWYPWDPALKDKWVRTPPEFAITELPGYDPSKPEGRADISRMHNYVAFGLVPESVVVATGLRSTENPQRMRLSRNWRPSGIDYRRRRYAAAAFPIVQWGANQVWNMIRTRGWDWNRHYLRAYQAGARIDQVRCGPWFGEEPSLIAHVTRRCSPDIWNKLEGRINGYEDLARYAATPLMGRGRRKRGDDEPEASPEVLAKAVEGLKGKIRKETIKSIRNYLQNANNDRVPARFDQILKIAMRGDRLGRLSACKAKANYHVNRANGYWRPDRIEMMKAAQGAQNEEQSREDRRRERWVPGNEKVMANLIERQRKARLKARGNTL